MIVTAHQLNFIPGLSVIDRIRRADVVIWLDGAQFVRHGWVNRNKLADGTLISVPVNEHDHFAAINHVRLADPTGRARKKIARTLQHHFGGQADPFVRELLRPYAKLAGLNHALIVALFDALGIQVEHRFQTFLDTEPALPVVTESGRDISLVRERYADMAAQLGADVYLSGPGRHHGDPSTFAEHGIRIEYTDVWEGPNHSAIELLRERVAA